MWLAWGLQGLYMGLMFPVSMSIPDVTELKMYYSVIVIVIFTLI